MTDSPAPQRLARVITELSAPWLVNTLAALYIGYRADALWWGLVAALIAGIVPILAILALVKAGRAGDHHVGDRRHRGLVVALITTLMVVGIVAEICGGAPEQILILSIAGLVTIAAVGLITTGLKYKVSVHTAVWSGTTLLLAALDGAACWWIAAAALPAVGWARVRLRDHTPAQTALGAGLGLLTVLATLVVLR